MAAAIATLSERKPGCIGMRSRTSAPLVHGFRHAGAFAAEQQDVVAAERVIEIRRRRRCGEQDQPQPLARAASPRRLPRTRAARC